MLSSASSRNPKSAPTPETDRPARLLRMFAGLSVVSVLAILLLAGFGIYRVISAEMTRVAEQWAIYVGNTIFEQERSVLLKDRGKGIGVAVDPQDFAALDGRMKKFLQTFEMYKIKAFSIDKRIIYSTDAKIIGMDESANPKLDKVLTTGAAVSELEHKDQVRNLKGEERLQVDVVECYVPIRAGNAVVGAFEVYVDITSTRLRVFRAMQGALSVLAAVLVVVFGLLYVPMRRGTRSLKQAEDRLAELASMDGLTGIFNRRFLMSRVQEERARMLRAKADTGRMAFIMADIDHFKRVNDTHGHLVGDAVLREISRRLKEGLRQYDVLGRYGGEEFLAMLPNTNLAEAALVADRLHRAVGSLPIRCEEGPELAVTISLGVAETRADEEVSQAISRADASLYRAKEAGRNRVCCDGQAQAAGSAEETAPPATPGNGRAPAHKP